MKNYEGKIFKKFDTDSIGGRNRYGQSFIELLFTEEFKDYLFSQEKEDTVFISQSELKNKINEDIMLLCNNYGFSSYDDVLSAFNNENADKSQGYPYYSLSFNDVLNEVDNENFVSNLKKAIECIKDISDYLVTVVTTFDGVDKKKDRYKNLSLKLNGRAFTSIPSEIVSLSSKSIDEILDNENLGSLQLTSLPNELVSDFDTRIKENPVRDITEELEQLISMVLSDYFNINYTFELMLESDNSGVTLFFIKRLSDEQTNKIAEVLCDTL